MKPSALNALFPRTRQELLGATLLLPERWWYMADLAKHLGRGSSSLQRELEGLTKADLLLRKRDGNRVYFRANRDALLFSELRGIFVKTVGLVDVLREALAPFEARISVAFIYGSVASGQEDAGSDMDLMVIGTIRSSDLASPLSQAEQRLARSVSATVYSGSEFAAQSRSGHHFIRSVLDGAKLFVVGTEDDVGSTGKGRKGRASQDHKDGAG